MFKYTAWKGNGENKSMKAKVRATYVGDWWPGEPRHTN